MTQLEILKDGFERAGIGYTQFTSEEVGDIVAGTNRIYIVPGSYSVPKNIGKFFRGLIETETCIEFNSEGRFVGI